MAVLPRIDRRTFQTAAPAIDASLLALSKAAAEGPLDHALAELVKLRASQINGCAFCAQMHDDAARKAGVPAPKLAQLAVWRHAPLFSARERAALGWTEAVTRAADGADDTAAYAAAHAAFDTAELIHLTGVIALINAWNRIAGPLRYTPPGSHAA